MNIPDILHFPESVHGQTYQRPNERCLNLSICLEIIKNQYRKSLSLPSFRFRKKEDGWTPQRMGHNQMPLSTKSCPSQFTAMPNSWQRTQV